MCWPIRTLLFIPPHNKQNKNDQRVLEKMEEEQVDALLYDVMSLFAEDAEPQLLSADIDAYFGAADASPVAVNRAVKSAKETIPSSPDWYNSNDYDVLTDRSSDSEVDQLNQPLLDLINMSCASDDEEDGPITARVSNQQLREKNLRRETTATVNSGRKPCTKPVATASKSVAASSEQAGDGGAKVNLVRAF